MAHLFITRVVVPRQEKWTTLNIHDAILLVMFLRKQKINQPRFILNHMGKCIARTHSLPYAALVKELMLKEELYQEGEEVELGRELEMVNIQKMKHSEVPHAPVLVIAEEGNNATTLEALNKLSMVAERILEVLLDIQETLSTSKVVNEPSTKTT